MPRRSRSTSQLTAEEKLKRRREQKRLSIRRARAKMTEADLEERREKDRERYRKRKEQGLLKTIKDFTPREQRKMRKLWREKAKIKREKEKENKENKIPQNVIETNSASSTPTQSRTSIGRAISKRNRRLLRTENIYLRKEIRKLETKLAKYRMRSIRYRRSLMREKELEKEKRKRSKKCTNAKAVETKKTIHSFLMQDEYSRSTSGKKETITRNGIKKQIRFLNDSLLNLHKIFVNKTGMTISYETFRRYRPFWVIFPRVESRNTILCAIHTNTNFIVKSLYNAKIIHFKSATDLVKSLCCNNILKVCCLERKCDLCKEKIYESNNFENDEPIAYERWVTKKVIINFKGNTKVCTKTLKEQVQTTKKQLIENFNSILPTFMKHVANMINQIRVIQDIKKNIAPDVGLLHIDFSENYNCKYSEEVQSAHFGGSKSQISLHTCVYYSTQLEYPNNLIDTTSFCTVSENLRHDPVLICVHLQALVTKIKEISPNLKHLHILSDGPSTQYRNKSMFNLIATYLCKEFGVDSINWHFSERGHGKGAPDGVGGCVKRICDHYVAKGNDVPNLEALMTCLTENCKGIKVYRINELLIPEIQKILDKSVLQTFKGTREIHQLTWGIEEPATIHAKRLSCLLCGTYVKCPHYEIGTISIKYNCFDSQSSPNNLEALVSQADSKTSDDSSDTSLPSGNQEAHNSPEGPHTPDALTASLSPGFSDRLTPEYLTNAHLEDVRPTKRPVQLTESENSDSSLDIFPLKKRPFHRVWDDSDEDSL